MYAAAAPDTSCWYAGLAMRRTRGYTARMLATWLLAASFTLAADVSPVTADLLEILGPERAAALRQPPELEPVALALLPEEKPEAKAVLARLEAAGYPALRPDIARAYALLGEAADAARLEPSLGGHQAGLQRALALVRQGDYEAAHGEAVALDQAYPDRPDIASLLAATRGRGKDTIGVAAAAPVGEPHPRSTVPSTLASKTIDFTASTPRRNFSDAPPDIDLSSNPPGEPQRRENGRAPLWPLVPIGLLSAGGYAVARRNKTFEAHDKTEDAPPPSTTDRFLAGAVVAGLAGAAVYYAGVVAAPVLMRVASSGGQQAVRIATSRAGAINPATNVLQRAPTLNNLNLQLTAQQISRGHAFTKHGAQFGVRTPEEFAHIIERALSNPTMVRNLSRGRVAYWHRSSATVVIRDPAAVDGGTAFIPSKGAGYFHSLR